MPAFLSFFLGAIRGRRLFRSFALVLGTGFWLCAAAPRASAQVDYTWVAGTGAASQIYAWETTTDWSPAGYAGQSGAGTPDSIVSFNPATPGGTISATLNNSAVYTLNNFNFTPTSAATTTNLLVSSNTVGGNTFTIAGLLTLNGNGEATGPALTFADGSGKNLTLNVANILVQNKATLFLGDTTRGIATVNVSGGTTLTSSASGGTGGTISLHLESNLAGGTKGTANLGLVTFGTAGFANSGNNQINLEGNSSVNADVASVTVAGIQTAYVSGTTYTAGTQQIIGLGGSRPGTSLVTLTINNASNYDTNATIIDAANGNTATGSLSLVKTGAGTQTLGGTGTNLYSGSTTINGGTLKLAKASALGYGYVVYQSGGATVAGTTPNPGVQSVSKATVNSGGALDLGGQTINKPIVLNGGALSNSGASATLSNGIAGISFSGSPTNLGTSAIPTVSISGAGSGATAVAMLGLTASSLTGSGGSGYAVGDFITVSGGGAIQNAVYSVSSVSSGAITGLALVTPGTGFTGTGVTISRTTGAGTGATLAFVDGTLQIVGIQTTAAGSGYTSTPTVTVGTTGIAATAAVTGLTLTGSGNTIGDTGNITVAGVVSGSGGFTKVGSDTLTFSGINTYGGGTTVSAGILAVNAGSSLGTGDVSVASGATLTLGDHAAVGASSRLILNVSSAVNLSFSGTDTIGALSLDGGATWVSAGTWGAVGSGATNTSALFSGAGLLQVTALAVPEPSTWALLGLGCGGLLLGGLRSRRFARA